MTAPSPEPPGLFLNPATHVVHLDEKCPGYKKAKHGHRINSMPTSPACTMCRLCSGLVVETFIDSTRT